MSPHRARSLLCVRVLVPALGCLVTAVALPAAARAESALRLATPGEFGAVPATTYDEDGVRVGGGELSIERQDGVVKLAIESGIDGAERTWATADLVEVDGGAALQIVRQTSQSVDGDGGALGVMSIDHVEGIGRCTPPEGDGETRTLRLPASDRVANVPLNLLFRPLVRGERDEMTFQIFVCRGGPRLLDARASVDDGRRDADDPSSQIIEIDYELELPAYLSFMARPFLPEISMWFDRRKPDAWLAHRMPLFSSGPTVLVVRSGLQPEVIPGF